MATLVKLNLTDLHPNLPSFIRNELLRLKAIATNAERLVKHHGWRTRRGSHWYNVGRRADRRYRKVWHLFPWPTEVSPEMELTADGMPPISLRIETSRFPVSGFVARMRMRYSFEATQDFKQDDGKCIGDSLWDLVSEEA